MADHPRDADEQDEASPASAPAQDVGAGRRRLTFASRYPDSTELDALLDAFERGNFAHVREAGPSLAKRTDDPEIARAARDLVSRLSPDPLAVRMLVGAGLLLLFLIYWFYSDHH